VVAFARLTKEPLTLDLASKALAEFHESAPRRILSPQSIIDKAAKYFDLEPEALLGRRRDKMTVLARHLAIYLIREETECSFNEIGRVMGNRDHSAILRGYEKIALDIDTSPSLRRDAIEIRERLYNRGEA
jgi:chromosomal replication initiator protein